jgi:hypothetical protein
MGIVKTLRVYADTSVFGGCFDEEFEVESLKFFEEVRHGRFLLVISDITTTELDRAPQQVQTLLAGIPADRVEVVTSSDESRALREAYIEARVVGRASLNDAEHIAVATVANVDIVVSWNFKHIVHFEKIGGYEGVNTLNGYRSPKIYSPREVVPQ